MPTEPTVQRLYRRLGDAQAAGAAAGTDSDSGPDDDDDPRSLLPRWLPDSLPQRGAGWFASVRADPGRAGVLALGVLAVLAVLVTVFTLVQAGPAPVVSAKLPPVQPVSTTAASGTAAAPGPQAVVVSVVGLVRTPGLVTLAPGARVADALSAAGGALDGADNVGLNLARRLADGEQVLVGIGAVPGGPPALGSSVGGGAPESGPGPPAAPGRPSGETLDLNAATVAELDTLPGVGPVTAAAIVAWRDKNGRFTDVEQLGEVDGIGPTRLDRLRDLVRV